MIATLSPWAKKSNEDFFHSEKAKLPQTPKPLSMLAPNVDFCPSKPCHCLAPRAGKKSSLWASPFICHGESGEIVTHKVALTCRPLTQVLGGCWLPSTSTLKVGSAGVISHIRTQASTHVLLFPYRNVLSNCKLRQVFLPLAYSKHTFFLSISLPLLLKTSESN